MTKVVLVGSLILLGASAGLMAVHWIQQWRKSPRLDPYATFKQERTVASDAIENLRRNAAASAERDRLKGGEQQ